MSRNATDTFDRVKEGFAELQKAFRESQVADHKKDRAATAAGMAREQARVRAEYLHLGLEPPHPLALSITARRELGYPLPQRETEPDENNP